MVVLPLILSLAAQAAPPDAAGPADPLAQAREGMLQCYAPDAARRTCKSLAGYVFGPNGIQNQAEVLISPQGPMVMKNSTPVEVRDGAVCGPIRAQDIDGAEVLFAGRPISGPNADQVKTQLKSGIANLLGAEVCTSFVTAPQGYTTRVTVNGQPAPQMSDAPMIWVRPGDGWTVAP
jgi:hypothetical protein